MHEPAPIENPPRPANEARPALHNPELGPAPITEPAPKRDQRPAWLPAYLPELQGLRGIAVILVVLYHNLPLLKDTWIYKPLLWGWSGVNLFFTLSGFLITSILIEARDKPHYFRDFYARRALRIWPMYVLLLVACYAVPDWFLGSSWAEATRWKTLLAYALFVQNLRHTPLPGTLGPTWSLAIEEQYYVVWAPVVRFLRGRLAWLLPVILSVLIVTAPVIRASHAKFLNPTHTLSHLDGIAMGSLLAISIYGLRLTRKTWLWIGLAILIFGLGGTNTLFHGPLLDTGLSLGFTGAVILAAAGTGARNPIAWLLRRGPLPYYGQISYGLYMTHILVFVYWGSFNAKLDHMGTTGHLIIVVLRLIAATLVATALWYGFESRILKLKKYFQTA